MTLQNSKALSENLYLCAAVDSILQTVKSTVTLTLFTFSVYALCMTDGINRKKFLLLMVSGVPNLVHLPRTLLVL